MCGTLQTSITSQLLICSCPPNQNTWLYIERSSYCLCIMWLVLSCVTIREGTGRRKWKNKSKYSHSYGEVIFIRKNRNFLAPKSQRILPKNTCPPPTHTQSRMHAYVPQSRKARRSFHGRDTVIICPCIQHIFILQLNEQQSFEQFRLANMDRIWPNACFFKFSNIF